MDLRSVNEYFNVSSIGNYAEEDVLPHMHQLSWIRNVVRAWSFSYHTVNNMINSNEISTQNSKRS